MSRKLKAESRKPEQKGPLQRQDGITSIVVVFVLVTLLTLISIGFTKIMNRSLQSSSASQQATAANYAAESGVNDVLSYLKTQPTTAATKCDDLIKTGAPLASAANLSGDGSTAYSCVLVDPNPTSLFYKDLDPYKSQIVKITTSTQLASLLFSWQSPNRQHYKSTPAGASQTLYDEKNWSNNNYAPLLRVTLYPVPADGNLSGVQAASKTFFLYPQIGGSNTIGYNASGNTSAVNCASKNIGSFSGSADFDCNLVINSLPSASYFYARFAPYYDQAIVKIKGNDASGQPVKFKNVQSVVDVTAKSGGATKRLQARLDISGTGFNVSPDSDSVPEFALGSADTICKRLRVQPPLVFIDPSIATNCPQIIVGPQKPTVNTTAATNVQQTKATLNGNVNPNGEATTYKFKYGITDSYGSTTTTSSAGAGTSAVNVNTNTNELPQGTTYHFQLCATNIANSIDSSESCGTDLTFKTKAPDPVLSFYTDNGTSSISIPYNTSTNLHWRITTGPADWCWGTDWHTNSDGSIASGKGGVNPPTGGDINTGYLTSSQTYHLYCGYNPTGYQTPTQTVTVTVADPPPQPRPPVQPPPQPYLTSFVNEPEGSNSLGWSGGHLQYCHIWGTDGKGNNMETNPVDTRPDGGNTTLGDGGPYNIWLQCRNQAGDSNTLPIDQVAPQPPQPPADIVIYPPSSNVWILRGLADPTQYDFGFSPTYKDRPPVLNDCRDGYHNLVLCFNLSASVGGDSSPSAIGYCTYTINNSIKTLSNISGTSHWSYNGWWITVSNGWNYTIKNTSPEGTAPGPYPSPYNLLGNTISADCYKGGDVIGGTGGTFVGSADDRTIDNGRSDGYGKWHTCGYRGQFGEYYNDYSLNNCTRR